MQAFKTLLDSPIFSRWTRVSTIAKLAEALSQCSITREEAEHRLDFLSEVTKDAYGVRSVVLSRGKWNNG